MKRKGAGILSPAPACAVFRYFTEMVLQDQEGHRRRCSYLTLHLEFTKSCRDLFVYYKYQFAYPGCRVHDEGFDFAFLTTQEYLRLRRTEPETLYGNLGLWANQ